MHGRHKCLQFGSSHWQLVTVNVLFCFTHYREHVCQTSILNDNEAGGSSYSYWLWSPWVFLPAWLPETTALSVPACVVGRAAGHTKGSMSPSCIDSVWQTQVVYICVQLAMSSVQTDNHSLLVAFQHLFIWWKVMVFICPLAFKVVLEEGFHFVVDCRYTVEEHTTHEPLY